MTVLRNSVHVAAPPEKVWAALARLDALHELDPGVVASKLCSSVAQGIGAARRCELRAGGWFSDRVTVWQPHCELAFELYDCTLPVRRLRHHYTLTAEPHGTRVEQEQEYVLKYGPLGALLDVLFVRRQWDAGIKGFFAGLKTFVERGDLEVRSGS